jgi:hypothetical protein
LRAVAWLDRFLRKSERGEDQARAHHALRLAREPQVARRQRLASVVRTGMSPRGTLIPGGLAMDLKIVSAARPAAMVLLGCLCSSACIARNAPGDRGVAAVPPPPAAPPAASNPTAAGGTTIAPAGYVPMHASDVVATRDGEAVLLLDEREAVAIPIFIGGSEATSIRLRLAKRRYERPLTHDLFDALMHEVGAELVKVQVDDLKNSTYLGSVFVSANGRRFELDARPSDAIALAIGNRVPIYVACKVIEATAIPRSSFLDAPRGPESDVQVEGCPPKTSPNPALKTTAAGW